MIPIEHLLAWNTFWVIIWALINLFFTVLLFFGKGNGIYKAMQLFMALLTIFMFRTAILTGINIVANPEPYYIMVVIAAFITPAGAFSAIWLAYQTWKAKQ